MHKSVVNFLRPDSKSSQYGVLCCRFTVAESTRNMPGFYHVIIVLLSLFHLSESICTVSCPTCPCFAIPSQTFSLPEDAIIGSAVFTFTATDPRSLTLTYSIRSNPPPDDFQIDSVTGELSAARELDYETTESYMFTVAVENTNGQRDSIDVIIEVTNVDDNPTWCAQSIATLSVIEEESIMDLQLPDCTDDDIPSSPSFDYSIIAGNEMGVFAITSGNISLLRPLDYEIQTIHDLSVSIVQSGGSLSFNMTVIIEVVPTNEYTPQFTTSTIDLTISESALISSTVGRVTATDNDAGNDGTITYSILLQSSNKFTIHPNTGEVIVARLLDYETVQSYSLSVVARDSPAGNSVPRSSIAQVQISIQDANDNRPYFTSYVYYTGVSEQYSVGYEVAHVQCNDDDSGLNQEVTYSIAAGNQEGRFQINTTSGQVALASALNYDDNNTQFYNITIECQEVQPPRGTVQAVLLVSVESFNEYFPDPGSDYRATVSEDAPPGTSILQVQGRDRDRGLAGKLTYLINDDTLYCPESIVYIDQFTGVIYLNAQLDYENGLRTIFCTILVQDSEQPLKSASADLLVTVTNANDGAPVCDPPMFNASISEDSPIGYEVLTLSCNDADSSILNYSILESSVPFQISLSGTITVDNNLDYETDMFYRVPIEVNDGEFSCNTTVFVNILGINEHTPVFTQAAYACSVNENEAVGAVVCTVSASDNDSGSDGTLNYQISMGTPAHSFGVDRESGRIYLTTSIDYENDHHFSLIIEAYDLGEPSHTASVSITISVNDLNDNRPQMDSFAFHAISENAALGDTVGTLNCTDADAGLNGQVTFQVNSIVKVNTDGTETLLISTPFVLESALTGVLIVNSNLDYEADQLYRLSIICRDSGTPLLATFSTVTITLQPENEHTPSFSQSTYSVDVSESTTVGSSILMVSASDNDAGIQGDIHYSIQSSESQPFAINPYTGVVSLIALLNCLQNLSYTLTVAAHDGGSPPLQSQVNVAVNVINCHLGDLIPQRSIYIGSVEENSPSGIAILTVACNSIRNSLPSSYSPKYRISNGDSNLFEMDEDSGTLSVLAPPDFEAGISHLLTLQCFDENHPEISADILAHISVDSVNEYAPEFREDPYQFSIEEGTPLGSVVFTIVAADSDSGRDGEVTYSINGNDSHSFFIDRSNGEVYLIEPLDRESESELTLRVSVHDNPVNISSHKSSVSSINIQVTDSNDHWPQCNRTVYHLIVSPRTGPGSILLSDLGCSDVDTGLNGELEYTLGSSKFGELFAVDRNEGRLILTKTLDSASYHVPITVEDRGTPSFSISILVVIDVQEPSHSTDASISDSDHTSLLEAEGLNNAVTITLNDISLILWETTKAPINFQEVVANTVTKYCAILPEACSLITGCSQFYGTRNRRSIENNYANFYQANIVVISNDTREMTALASGGADILTLEIRFYVTLPSSAERAPYRETNYVVPRATLSEIVNQDGATIEAVVRNSLSPLLIPQMVHQVDEWRVTGIAFSLLFSVIIFALILVAVRKIVIIIKQKKSNRVVPIKKSHRNKDKAAIRNEQNSKPSASELFTRSRKSKANTQMTGKMIQAPLSSSKMMNTSFTGASGSWSSRQKGMQSKCSPTGVTMKWHCSGTNESSESNSSPLPLTESSSRISLDHDQASMENNATSRSRRSTSSDLDSSVPSNLGGSRGSRDGPGSDDYLDNFPYAPPNRKPIPSRHIITSRWSIKPK